MKLMAISKNAFSRNGYLSFKNFSISTLSYLGEVNFGKVYCAQGLQNRKIALVGDTPPSMAGDMPPSMVGNRSPT